MKLHNILFCLPLFLLLFSAGIASATTLKASVFDLHPFGGRDEEGRLVGIIPEILEVLERETGLDIEIKVVPYKRMFHELESGSSDFAIFFRTMKSEQVAKPMARIYTLRNIVVGKGEINLGHYEDLSGRLISVPLGTYYQDKFDNDQSLNKIFVSGFSNAVKQLLSDRTDLVAGPELSINYHLKQLGSTKDILGEPLFLSYTSAWLQTSEKSQRLTPSVQEKLIAGVQSLHDEGIIEKILNHYRQ